MAALKNKFRSWSKDELEDAYLRIYDENQEFRRVIADQNMKIKTLGTKLMRVTKDSAKYSDVYAKTNEEVSQADLPLTKGIGAPSTESTYLLRKLKEEKFQKAALDEAIKRLNNRNIQMKFRIKELESLVGNQKKATGGKIRKEELSKEGSVSRDKMEDLQIKRNFIEKEREEEKWTDMLERRVCEQAVQTNSELPENVADYAQSENKVLREFNEGILPSSSVEGEGGPDSRMMSVLLEKLQHLERELSAWRKDRERQYEEICRVHTALQTRAQQSEARIDALSRCLTQNQFSTSLQELCWSIGVDVRDLEAAIMRMRRRKDCLTVETCGDVLQGLNSPTSPMKYAEVIETEKKKGLSPKRRPRDTQCHMAQESWAMSRRTEAPFDSPKALAVQEREDCARLLDLRATHSTQMDAHRVSLGTENLINDDPELKKDRNLFEINLGEINLTPNQLKACPRGVFCVWRFYNFEEQSTDVVRGRRSNFNVTVQYPVVTDELFWSYLHEKRCHMELHKVMEDMSSQQIGRFDLDLQDLLRPDMYASPGREGGALHAVRVSRVGQFLSTKQAREEEIVGQVVYWMGFRAPIGYSFRDYFDQQRKKDKAESFDRIFDVKTIDTENQQSTVMTPTHVNRGNTEAKRIPHSPTKRRRPKSAEESLTAVRLTLYQFKMNLNDNTRRYRRLLAELKLPGIHKPKRIFTTLQDVANSNQRFATFNLTEDFPTKGKDATKEGVTIRFIGETTDQQLNHRQDEGDRESIGEVQINLKEILKKGSVVKWDAKAVASDGTAIGEVALMLEQTMPQF